MIAVPLFLMALTCLLRARSSSQAADHCQSKSKIHWADCEKAYRSIIYVEPDATLPLDEKHVERAHRTCVVTVQKKYETVIRKKDVEKGFKKMHDECKESSPYAVPGIDGAILKVRARGSVPYTIEDDAPSNKPVCIEPKQGLESFKKIEDCATAFEALPTTTNGRFSDNGKRAINSVRKTVKTCFVVVFTSDGSEIVATKKHVRHAFKRMLDKCNSKWAGIPLDEGARGLNGRLIMIAIPSKDL